MAAPFVIVTFFSSVQRSEAKRIKQGAVFFLLGSSTTLLLMALAAAWLAGHERRAALQPGLQSTRIHSSEPSGKVPPWGRLEAVQIPLANPEGTLPDEHERLQQPKWFFESATEGRLTRFLNSCDLLPAQRKILLDKKHWNITTNGCEISPPEMLVWSLNSQTRRQIYSVLSKNPANYP